MTAAGGKPAEFPIRAVSRLTGIGIDTLRAWERRYEAVVPRRDGRGRLYTEADIVRLRLLSQAIASGHSIGRVAALSDEELRLLANRAAAPPLPPLPNVALDVSSVSAALATLDSVAIDREFARVAAGLPPLDLVRDVLLPALRDVGDRWNREPGGIAHEHLVSSTMRHLLGSFLRLYSRGHPPVRLLFTTPSGDRHEIGILCAAMLAASQGLGVAYVGPDLPAAEIVEAVKAAQAQVLVLGLTLKAEGSRAVRELRAIIRDLPPVVELWAGGPGAERHAGLLTARGLVVTDFDAYLQQLGRLGGRTV